MEDKGATLSNCVRQTSVSDDERVGKQPCSLALAAGRVPAAKFVTRVDLLEILEKVRQRIEGDPTQDFDLASLGNEVGLSKFHLQRRFRQVYGKSPHELRQHYRLALACKLLSQSVNVTDVCFQCGFTSTSSFGRLFKREFGFTPGQYRSRSGPA